MKKSNKNSPKKNEIKEHKLNPYTPLTIGLTYHNGVSFNVHGFMLQDWYKELEPIVKKINDYEGKKVATLSPYSLTLKNFGNNELAIEFIETLRELNHKVKEFYIGYLTNTELKKFDSENIFDDENSEELFYDSKNRLPKLDPREYFKKLYPKIDIDKLLSTPIGKYKWIDKKIDLEIKQDKEFKIPKKRTTSPKKKQKSPRNKSKSPKKNKKSNSSKDYKDYPRVDRVELIQLAKDNKVVYSKKKMSEICEELVKKKVQIKCVSPKIIVRTSGSPPVKKEKLNKTKLNKLAKEHNIDISGLNNKEICDLLVNEGADIDCNNLPKDRKKSNSPKKTSPKKKIVKKTSPKETSPKKKIVKKKIVKKTSPKKTSPKETSPKKTSPKKKITSKNKKTTKVNLPNKTKTTKKIVRKKPT